MDSEHKITTLLNSWRTGSETALDELIPLVHQELLRQSHAQIRREARNHTLSPTDLLSELYLRLRKVHGTDSPWQSRTQFFAFVAHNMRRYLRDYARRREAQRRGGGVTFLEIKSDAAHEKTLSLAVLDLDNALTELNCLDPLVGRLVELKYFAGFTVEEIAAELDIGHVTVWRKWRFARRWLADKLQGEKSDSEG